ncbi:MAG TPA: AI-2E family transporter [Chthoniobacterales bacterium]|nr:AI-2E family transporter [Chthoniobacterales bacterium]
MLTPRRISYAVLVSTLVLAGWLRLGAPLLAVLFSYFALCKLLAVTKNKWVAFILFVLVVGGIACGAAYFTRAAIRELPEVADSSLPSASAWAQARQIELPFTDFDSLKAFVIDAFKEETNYLKDVASFARSATTVLIFVAIGIVAAVSLFINSQLDISRRVPASRNNLYSVLGGELSARFRDFYQSFATVMGAQITISLINTFLTAIFVLTVQLPDAPLLIGVTFLCGLLPIVGNLVSNTIIVCVAFTVSLKTALVALIFLIAIHKLEYFLNSKIIGDRIRNPIWLTLIALVIGERLMGIPGMVLAPVVLNYLRVEMSKIEATTSS